VIRHLRPSRNPLVHGEHDATDLSGPVICRDVSWGQSSIGITEILAGGFIGCIARRFGVEMDVSVDSNEFVKVEFLNHRSPGSFSVSMWPGPVFGSPSRNSIPRGIL